MAFEFKGLWAGAKTKPVQLFYVFLFLPMLFLGIPVAVHSQCPTIAAILIDACGTEQNNEFVVINSGGGFLVDNLQLDYDINNNILSPVNNDININANPCGLQTGNPAMISGCTNVIPVGLGFFIPANSYVILECSSGANLTYDFSGVCGTQQCVYVIQSTCPRTAGGFTNSGPGLRTQVLGLTTGCSTSYVYDRALLVGGNGAYFIPPATYGNGGCIAPPVSFGNLPTTPVISGIPASICQNAASIALPTNLSGITGNWSGSGVTANNFSPAGLSGNITLTFTPTAGLCASVVSTTILVNVPVTPFISGIPASICQSASAIALPTTQSGITGNWSGSGVAGNNFNPSGLSGSITLTFTPTAGQCANSVTTTIVVNVPVTPAISGIPATMCQLDSPVSLPTSQSGINGNWSGTGVSGNNFDPSGLSGNITLTFTPTAGQCANATTTTINVSAAVTPAISGLPASMCQTDSPVSLPTTQSGINGNWSGTGVSGNNFNPSGLSGNITLTFTPTAGQCAIATTTSIDVNVPVTPAISGIPASICQSDSPIALPTTQSGITGTWSGTGVAGNNFNPSGLSGSITLTFTPVAGQCANSTTTNINVNGPVTPAISGIPASICQSDNQIVLPTTQSGITGTWSGTGVAGNNFDPSGLSGSVTLTFTPNAGQCANANTTSINVNVPVTPVISGIPASMCQLDNAVALPTTQSGITGTWSGTGVAGNNFNPSGLSGNITLTFTPNAGQCASIASTAINVNAAVTPAISGIPASLCQNDNPVGLPTTQSGINGTWSGAGVAGNNFNPTGLSGNITLTFTPTAGQCANNATTTIDVNVPVTPVITGIPPLVCQLNFPLNLPTTQSGITGNWSGTGVVANTFNPAGLTGTITITFTPNAGQCANIATANITINIPVVPTITGIPASICQNASPIALPTLLSGITGNWSGQGVAANNFDPAGLSGNITLTFTPTGGQCAVLNTTTITVNIPVSPNITGVPASICQNDPQISLPTTEGGFSGNWSGQGVNANNFNPSGLGGNITLTFTPNAGQCAVAATTSITVNTVPSFLNIMENCDMLNQNYTVTFTIIGGIPGTYTVNGQPVGGSTFTSGPIPSGTGYIFNLDDAAGCGPATVSGSFNCNCATFSGTMNFANTPLHICDNSGFTVDHNGNELLDANDVLEFVLHTDPGGQLGIVLEVSGTTTFVYPGNIIPGQIYYVSAVAGNNNGSGGVDLNDPCLSISQGVPVIFYSPTAVFGPGGSVCEDGCFDFQVQYTGFTPYSFDYAVHALGNVFNFTITSNTNSSTVNICPSDYGVDNGQIQLVPISITDANCTFDYVLPPAQTLTVHPIAINTLTPTLCPGGSIVVNGTLYDQANPNGTEVLQNASTYGCDSMINVSLSFYADAVYNLTQTLCTGGSVTVNGTVYDAAHPSGTEIILNGSVHGCDSTVNVNLSFSNIVTFNLNQTLCPNGSIVVNGTIYNAGHPSGAETFVGGSYLGCDSVVNVNLSFYPPPVFNLTQTLCTGGSITVNGTVYDAGHPSGTEVLLNASIHGCDSTVNVNLTFNSVVTFNLNSILCFGDDIVVNGTIYNAANPTGSETFIGGSYLGCDSVVNVNLSFYPQNVFDLIQTLCAGEFVIVNGTIYNQANPNGMEMFANADINGCDSIVNVSLSFNSVSTNTLSQTLCPGKSITVNGTIYNAAHPVGTETIIGGNYLGCDSVVNVSLTFYAPSVKNLNQTLCPGASITVNGTVYNQAHPIGSEVLPNASVHGCDSTINIILTFFPASVYNLTQTLCIGGSLTVNGTIYDQANPTGTEIIPNASIHGCDSTVNVNLSFNSVVTFDLNQTLCPGGSVVVNGTTYNAANPTGSETFVGGSYLGCDSIVNIILTFYPASVHMIDSTLQQGQTITVNGTIYSEAKPTGTEVIVGGSANGCDSTININLHYLGNLVMSVSTASPVCVGGNDGAIIIDGIAGGAPPYTVTLNGANATTVDTFPIIFIGLNAGSYAVRIQDALGTILNQNVVVVDPPSLLVDLGGDHTIQLGESVTLSAQTSFPVMLWLWTPSMFLDCTDCSNPTSVDPTDNITYNLMVTDSNGCTAADDVRIVVTKSTEVYFPSVFSPNGDGINDVFSIFGNAQVTNVNSLQIFDRWGTLLYSIHNLVPNDQAQGWDGTFKGQQMNVGVYVWSAEVQYSDGRTEIFKGGVTLVR